MRKFVTPAPSSPMVGRNKIDRRTKNVVFAVRSCGARESLGGGRHINRFIGNISNAAGPPKTVEG